MWVHVNPFFVAGAVSWLRGLLSGRALLIALELG
jgi:hypothetical protein